MARQLPMLGATSGMATASLRKSQVRLGVWIELVTSFWMTIEASVAITVGFATRSVSLQGFGMDSIVELIAGGILLWRLLVEQRGGPIQRIEVPHSPASSVPTLPLFSLSPSLLSHSYFS